LPRPFAGNPGATATRLAHPPPAKLVVSAPNLAAMPPTGAAQFAHDLADVLAARDVPALAMTPKPGDWQAVLSASQAGGEVTPRATLIDGDGKPQGDVTGNPVPAAAWQSADPATLTDAAQNLAPRFEDMLRSVEARIAENDPNSLYHRPAQILLLPVIGAPGDGNRALYVTMRDHLIATGDRLTDRVKEADFIVGGSVKKRNIDARTDQIEIHWHVTASDGREAGDVAQGHDFPKASLDSYWGEVADAVAEEAAPGVHTVITNFTGRPAR
jgi:hypothetical protein